MNYKKSKYNVICADLDDDVLVFNCRSNSVVLINKEFFDNEIIETENFFEDDLKLIKELVELKILVPCVVDETSWLKIEGEKERYNRKDTLFITISLTYSCNMKCLYCYQNEDESRKMSYETADMLILAIKKLVEKFHGLHIVWFGGEPLLACDMIDYISENLMEFCDNNKILYEAYLTTNGTLLTKDVVKMLIKNRVKFIQVTLDGKERHNGQRLLKNGEKSFDLIVNNVLENIDSEEIRFGIRSNITSDSLEDNKLLIDELLGLRKLAGKLYFQFYPVSKFGNRTAKDKLYCNYCQDNDYNRIILELIKHVMKYQSADTIVNLQILSSLLPCLAVTEGYFVFDCYGDIYKCELVLQDSKMVLCNVKEFLEDNNVIFNHVYHQWMEKSFSEECNECKILPICHSGCVAERLLRKEDHVCTINRGIFKEIMKLKYRNFV